MSIETAWQPTKKSKQSAWAFVRAVDRAYRLRASGSNERVYIRDAIRRALVAAEEVRAAAA
jgi:hypothetical protein